MAFYNGKNLKSMRLLLFYQAIYARQNWSLAFPNGKSLKSMRLLLLYQAIYVRLNWSITYLPTNELYSFCRNCLTTFLTTYDVNEKYPSYMLIISCHYYCSKFVSAFCGMAHCGVFYCQKAFMGSMHCAAIA